MATDEERDFHAELAEILKIPGVKQTSVALWAKVDPSTVTRWVRGAAPADPLAVVKLLRAHAEQARNALAPAPLTSVDSWRSLYRDLDPGVRDYVDQSGLLAGMYYAILCWVPSSVGGHECDVVALRFFDSVWAAMSRQRYNIGDHSQIVTAGKSNRPDFDQEEKVSGPVTVTIETEGGGAGRSFARLRIELDLAELSRPNDSIGFVDSFGYRFCAKGAIAIERTTGSEQTNEFLGAPIVIPTRRLKLIVCIPESCLRGRPSGMTYSNRTMLQVLTKLDDANPEMIDSLMWPRGRPYEMSGAPDAPLKRLPHVASVIENMPPLLQEALTKPADLKKPDSGTIQDVLRSKESQCFMLDLHEPHPSLTATLVWRLATPASS